MPNDKLDAALEAEYLHLQKTIEDFDGRAVTIKAWSVTFGLVAIAGAFASHSSIPFLIAAASASIFWMLEVAWKRFQSAHYDRILQIERHFRGQAAVEHPFQMTASWFAAYGRDGLGRSLSMAIWLHVALPHVVVLLLGLTLFVLARLALIAT